MFAIKVMPILSKKRIDKFRSSIKNITKSSMEASLITSLPSSLSLPAQITIYAGTVLVFCLVWKLVKHLRERTFMIPVWRNAIGAHHWQLIGIITHTAYCGVCESLIVDGFYCDSCGFCSDFSCHKKADSKYPCKTLSVGRSKNSDYKQKHHWIHGNLPSHSVCDFCKDECGDANGLIDYRCCWCQRTVHELNCFTECNDDECDFGEWRRCIVPPFCITHKQVWINGRRKVVVESVTNFVDEPNWKPLLVIANKKSGNNDGDQILKAFRAILNPMQVIDLNETPIESGLEWCKLLAKTHKETSVRILVAAGDGSVGWVLNTIEKLKLDPKPLVGILPLGTGNDLSNVLGWGQSFSCESSMDHVMQKVLNAHSIDLDRWKIKFIPPRRFGISLPATTFYMNNYFSVGVDALVALNFHKTREYKIYNYFFSNRFFNKFLYLLYGTKDGWERRCKNLNEKIKLEMDGKEIDLPELESILVLNIPCWGGGCDIYNMGAGAQDAPKQYINDKKIEVLGIYSSFHIGQLLIGLSEPLRFGQAKVIKIKLLDRLPIQIDGEPRLQFPTCITIAWNSQAKMLTTRSERKKSKIQVCDS